MATSQALPGSAFHPSWTTRGGHRRLRPLSAVEAREPIGVTILVRPGSPDGADACARVGGWVRRAKVGPTAVDPVTGRVQVSGPTVDLARHFGVELERFSWDRDGGVVEYRGHRGPVMVPAEIAGLVVGVYGLDDRPVARSHVRTLDEAALLAAYNPAEVAALYAYPRLPRSDAPRELTAAMIELGGVTHQRDVELSFARLGLPRATPAPATRRPTAGSTPSSPHHLPTSGPAGEPPCWPPMVGSFVSRCGTSSPPAPALRAAA